MKRKVQYEGVLKESKETHHDSGAEREGAGWDCQRLAKKEPKGGYVLCLPWGGPKTCKFFASGLQGANELRGVGESTGASTLNHKKFFAECFRAGEGEGFI